MNAPSDLSPVEFIAESAADEDFFKGAHGQLAAAIALTVGQTKSKTIGLLGSWGSGKSTVINLVKQDLKTAPRGPFHLFSFDAWIHQSDPPRRAFLEQLIAFLRQAGFGNDKFWTDELDELQRKKDETTTRTTPQLTAIGKAVLLPLFLLPFGLAFATKPWFDVWTAPDASGWTSWAFPIALAIIALPIAAMIGSYWYLRPKRHPFARSLEFWRLSNWRQHRKGYEDESILALVSNKHVVHQHSSLIKAVEPTAIEFQTQFRRILKTIGGSDRLVIVVDNLDRLDRDEAVAMWTTIRSFFLGAIPDGEEIARDDLPTVILPIDASAIQKTQKLGGKSADDETLGQSFLEKSFDVVFHVAPPVLTQWQAYLAKQMKAVFRDNFEAGWVDEVARIYRQRLDPAKPVTPRHINKTVNAIAALWLQARDQKIPFVSLALFAIFRDAIERNLVNALTNPPADISDLDPEWRTSIPALHYGVAPDVAVQVLLDGALRQTVSTENVEQFQGWSKWPGFGDAVVALIDDNSFLAVERIGPLATLLATVDQEDPKIAIAWRRLGHRYVQSDLWTGIRSASPEVAKLLFKHMREADLPKLVRGMAGAIKSWTPALLDDENAVPDFAALISIMTAAADRLKIELPAPKLPPSEKGLLELAALTASHAQARKFVLGGVGSIDLCAELERQLLQRNMKRLETKAEIVLEVTHRDRLDDLVSTAGTVIETASADFDAKAAAAIILGRMFQTSQPADDLVHASAVSGNLQSLLNLALAADALPVAARAIVLMLLAEQNPAVSAHGSWQALLDAHPELAGLVDEAFADYREAKFFHLLVSAIARDAAIRPLIDPLVAKAIAGGRIGKIDAADLIEAPKPVLAAIEPGDRLSFMTLASAQEDFWPALESRPLDAGPLKILLILIFSEQAQTRKTARTLLSNKLKAAPSAGWTSAVRDGGSLFSAASQLQDAAKRPIALGQPLFDALTGLLPDLIASTERPNAANWFAAANFLSASFRKTLFRNIRDQLLTISSPPRLWDLLNAGGDLLLTEGEFGAKGDEVMRLIVLPLVRDGGLHWVTNHQKKIAEWYRAAPVETQQVVRSQLEDLAQGLDGEDKARAELLLASLRP